MKYCYGVLLPPLPIDCILFFCMKIMKNKLPMPFNGVYVCLRFSIWKFWMCMWANGAAISTEQKINGFVLVACAHTPSMGLTLCSRWLFIGDYSSRTDSGVNIVPFCLLIIYCAKSFKFDCVSGFEGSDSTILYCLLMDYILLTSKSTQGSFRQK